ncbi:multi antimicrobial extrusion protein MatE [Paenibacillus sp. H1-7]|uniref:multi antimicrobial extrusion protein MatE n=1 Tax=Paenibacillus sp. H1-7 TaxID=2282849 RepID=UPI001EF87751|nr:multi antimicrobial extrusion protein MatE [Paenibacillus sp. H1-7]ULL17755.1 multi antimicrobial extrusion protein MatE [Paenibacillus sp. H1-7]
MQTSPVPQRSGAAPFQALSFRQLLLFFLPLGASASLVMISHVIINGTLARSAHPELLIASYTIALSLMDVIERPAILLRQTCSALVRDKVSFRAMSAIAAYLLVCCLIVGSLISYTPMGPWVFIRLFGAEPSQVPEIVNVFQWLNLVILFSGVRCLFHGIIIVNLRTKWLTIGMGIRLIGMFLVAAYFVSADKVTSGSVGALIFLTGMAIECIISVIEGRSLLRRDIPEKLEGHPVTNKAHIFRFYRPLMVSSFLAVMIDPAINAALGTTGNMELAIASFAIALNLAHLMQSFFSYLHQIVLNFYHVNARKVFRFAVTVAFLPAVLVSILGYSPAGPWFLEHVIGVQAGSPLMKETLQALRWFMIMNLVFPWLDYLNGLLMLRGQTKVMVWSQACNVAVAILMLVVLVRIVPYWSGSIGALAQSLGLAAEIGVVLYVLRASRTASGKTANQAF